MSDSIATLTEQFGKTTFTLELRPDMLVHRWHKGKEHGEERISFSKLSSDLSFVTSRPKYTSARLIGGLLLLCLSLLIVFSVVQENVPLLAPFIGAIGIWLLVVAVRNLRIETWTVIHKRDGEPFAYIEHGASDDAERLRFEESFEATVKNSSGATDN